MLLKDMIKLSLFVLLIFITSGCVNKHGISAKVYSDCNEYYDLQGYYHKDCGDDDIITYKTMLNAIKKKDTKPKSNVW